LTLIHADDLGNALVPLPLSLEDPSRLPSLRDEVDRVCGSESVRYEHLQKFKYIDAALKETLRLKSTAPAWAVIPKKDEVIGGFYKVDKGQTIVVVLDALHRDPKVWGDDVEDFRPERMLDGRFEALPPDAWKPFGQCVSCSGICASSS
jgi:cytochrome P450/NADPH-cytochrome P450 reductase